MPQSTFNPANDGYVYGLDASYATARATANNHNNTVNPFVGQYFDGAQYFVYRALLCFDTSAIPAGAVVRAATLALTTAVDNSATDFDLLFSAFAGDCVLDAGNREAAFDELLSAALADVWRNTSGIGGAGTTNTHAVPPTLIVPGGTTKLGVISSRDVVGTTPTGLEFVRVYPVEDGTAAYRPLLTVDWVYPAALGPNELGWQLRQAI